MAARLHPRRAGTRTILYPGGAAFRVWAPFDPAFFAGGSFNNFSHTANPFAKEGSRLWSFDVSGAKVGGEYRFETPDGGRLPSTAESISMTDDSSVVAEGARVSRSARMPMSRRSSPWLSG